MVKDTFIKGINIREIIREKERKLFSGKVEVPSKVWVYSDKLVLCRDSRKIDDKTILDQRIIMGNDSFEKVEYHTEKRVVTLYGKFTVEYHPTSLVLKEAQEIYNLNKLVLKLADSESVCNLLQCLPIEVTYKRPYR